MGKIVTSTVASRYHKKIWVKYDFERKYVVLENFSVGLEGSAAGASAGGNITVQREFDWYKIRMEFSPIAAGDYKRYDIDCHDAAIVYLTIVADDGEVICNAHPKKADRCVVITEAAKLRDADKKKPWSIIGYD